MLIELLPKSFRIVFHSLLYTYPYTLKGVPLYICIVFRFVCACYVLKYAAIMRICFWSLFSIPSSMRIIREHLLTKKSVTSACLRQRACRVGTHTRKQLPRFSRSRKMVVLYFARILVQTLLNSLT